MKAQREKSSVLLIFSGIIVFLVTFWAIAKSNA
jgi:hypothetical protein